MAVTVRELITRIGFKVDKNSMNKAEKSAMRMKKILRGVGIGAAAIGTALVGIGVAAVKAASDIEVLTTQFEVMLGSTEKANDLMEKLKTFSAATPFALEDLAQGTQNLLSFGVAEEDVLDTMRMLGDTAGGNREKLSALVLAFGKVQTKGKVSMEEINMIAERGVPIIGTLVDQLGVTEQEFFKLISAGKIGRKDIQQAFRTMTSEGGMFFKGMEKASLTMAGMISTMKDNFKLLLAGIGEGLLPTIKELVGLMTELAQGPLKELGAGLTAVLVPVFQALSKILPKLIKFLVPILTIVGEILGELLVGLMPLFDLLEPILELVEALLPLIQIVVEVLVFLIPILVFILKIVIKIVTFLVKGFSKIYTTYFNLLKKIGKGVLKLKDFIVNVFKKIVAPISKIINKIGDIFRSMWDGLAMSVNSVIDTFNKMNPLNKFDIKGRLGTFRGAKEISQAQAGATTTTNITAPMSANVNVKVTGDKAARPRDIGSAVKSGVQGAFSFELRKLIIASAR
jgi:tape measure domain-containing protein